MIRCLSIATVLTGMAITLNAQNMKPLTPEEERVIVRKGTEAPFSGKYYLHDEDFYPIGVEIGCNVNCLILSYND